MEKSANVTDCLLAIERAIDDLCESVNNECKICPLQIKQFDTCLACAVNNIKSELENK